VIHFQAIAAMSLNRVIGCGNRIPWHLPEDFKWFKKMTTGHVVVMGRKTFESIGKPLPDRETIVLSRSQFRHPGVRTVASLSEIDALGARGFDRAAGRVGVSGDEARIVFICGGAQIYEQALPLCFDLWLTLVKRTVEGDVFFPRFEDRFVMAEEILDCPDFTITRYCNRAVM